ncbi:hypothetical protein VTN96DRAFT_1534 [Rasamsonia emersonii]
MASAQHPRTGPETSQRAEHTEGLRDQGPLEAAAVDLPAQSDTPFLGRDGEGSPVAGLRIRSIRPSKEQPMIYLSSQTLRECDSHVPGACGLLQASSRPSSGIPGRGLDLGTAAKDWTWGSRPGDRINPWMLEAGAAG